MLASLDEYLRDVGQTIGTEVLIWGLLLNWTGLGGYTLVAAAIAWAGYA